MSIWVLRNLVWKLKLNLEGWTVATNRDQGWDVSTCRDVLFQSVESVDQDKDKNRDNLRLCQYLPRCHISKCQEFLDSQDVIFHRVEKVSGVETCFF